MPTGMEKEEESVCSFIAARPMAARFGRVFTPRGRRYVACASLGKMAAISAPLFFFRAHDGTRRIPGITTRLHRGGRLEAAAGRYSIRGPCCVGPFGQKPPPKTQRSHVTCICSTILLTFSLVKGKREQASDVVHFPRAGARGRQRVRPARPGLTARCCVLTAPAPPCVLHTVRTCCRQFCSEKYLHILTHPPLVTSSLSVSVPPGLSWPCLKSVTLFVKDNLRWGAYRCNNS